MGGELGSPLRLRIAIATDVTLVAVLMTSMMGVVVFGTRGGWVRLYRMLGLGLYSRTGYNGEHQQPADPLHMSPEVLRTLSYG